MAGCLNYVGDRPVKIRSGAFKLDGDVEAMAARLEGAGISGI